MKRLGEEERGKGGEATEEDTIDKGENGGSFEQQVGEKTDNVTAVVENAPTLKISGTWTLRTLE